jgi:predicted dehydrogenase
VATLGCWYAHNGKVALECLERGIHVVTDKPAVNTWAEWSAAEALTRMHPDLYLLTEFGTRVNPAYRAAFDAVQQGRIGRPVLVRAQKSYRFGVRPAFFKQREHFAGLVMWVASHALDYMRWVSGLEFTSFQGLQGNVSQPDYGEMEDHVALLAEMTGDATATLTADYLRPDSAPTHGDDRLRVAGTRGIVEVIDGICTLITHEEPPEVIGRGPAGDLATAQELVDTLRGNGQGLFSTAETLRTHRAMLAARDAADWGRQVQLR